MLSLTATEVEDILVLAADPVNGIASKAPQTALDALGTTVNGKAPLASPTFTGNVTVPDPSLIDVSSKPVTTKVLFGREAKVVTTLFRRTDNTVASTINVSVNINGNVKSGTITKNAAGEVLSMMMPDVEANAGVSYARTDSVVASVQQQSRTVNVGPSEFLQYRNVSRNAANEILQITAWG